MNALFEKINNLTNMQKLLLVVVVIGVVIIAFDLYKNVSKYTNVTKIEKMGDTPSGTPSNTPTVTMETPSMDDEEEEDDEYESDEIDIISSTDIEYGNILINPEKVNVTLFYAEWCGHCNKFMNETWGQLKENFESNPMYKLNEVNCTNMKSNITTPAGKNIEGFPTLIFNYKNKKGEYIEEEYNGPRTFKVLSSVLEKFQ